MDAEEKVARWIYHKAGQPFPVGEVTRCETSFETGEGSCGNDTCREEYTEFSAVVHTSDSSSYACFEASDHVGLGYILEEVIKFEKELHPLIEVETDG